MLCRNNVPWVVNVAFRVGSDVVRDDVHVEGEFLLHASYWCSGNGKRCNWFLRRRLVRVVSVGWLIEVCGDVVKNGIVIDICGLVAWGGHAI